MAFCHCRHGLITAFDHASAQVSDLIAVTGEERQQEWQPPKLTDLPLTWWETFESAEQERLDSLASVFVQSMTEETAGLTGENLLVGQRYLAGIESEFELLSLAMQDLQLVEIPLLGVAQRHVGFYLLIVEIQDQNFRTPVCVLGCSSRVEKGLKTGS